HVEPGEPESVRTARDDPRSRAGRRARRPRCRPRRPGGRPAGPGLRARGARRDQVSAVVARWPRFLDAWARLGDLARDDVEAYAAYRVGYHRGLDRLRQNGWGGSGYVRGTHPENRGFLRSLDGLRRTAGLIGESDEEERCAQFLRQLDP